MYQRVQRERKPSWHRRGGSDLGGQLLLLVVLATTIYFPTPSDIVAADEDGDGAGDKVSWEGWDSKAVTLGVEEATVGCDLLTTFYACIDMFN